MAAEMTDRLDRLVARLLEHGDHRLTVTATLDLTPDGSGQPPVLHALRQAGREAATGLEPHEADAVEAEMAEIETAATDASARGLLGLVWLAHPAPVSAKGAGAESEPFTVIELDTPVRTAIHAGHGPSVFEVARAAYLDRPVVLVTADTHSMDVTRVAYGTPQDHTEVDWPQHYLSKLGQRTGRDARGGGREAGQGSPGHSYNNVQRYVQAHRDLFANEAAEHLANFLQDGDLLVVEGVDEARQQLLARLPETMRARAVELNAADPTEGERERFARLQAIAERVQLENAAARVEDWFTGGQVNTLSGIEAIQAAAEQGRVATVIVHQDAADHFGTASDMRRRESPVDTEAAETALQAALRQGAVAIFTDDQRVLDEGGMIAVARY